MITQHELIELFTNENSQYAIIWEDTQGQHYITIHQLVGELLDHKYELYNLGEDHTTLSKINRDYQFRYTQLQDEYKQSLETIAMLQESLEELQVDRENEQDDYSSTYTDVIEKQQLRIKELEQFYTTLVQQYTELSKLYSEVSKLYSSPVIMFDNIDSNHLKSSSWE